MIVGTDLKQVERVTGRLTRGKVAMGGAASGMWFGALIGFLMTTFTPGATWSMFLTAVLLGAFFRDRLGGDGLRADPRSAGFHLRESGRGHPL
ncbi:MAG: hypothetical protein IPM90_15705 [Austwickia sp.]|nr:hypothetical protein [Austwickia sp.]